MEWIVIGETDGGKIKLVSKNGTTGILPKGSYLTVKSKNSGKKFILRVDESRQIEPFTPSPLVVDLGLEGLSGDTNCKNEVLAYRICDIDQRPDGLIDFISPQSIAVRSTQEEVDLAIGGVGSKGPKIFVATIHSNQDQVLRDEKGVHITAKIPEDTFFHQMLICGKTGSGKTVSMKYLAQYFIEKMQGAVLAVNVKDIDFLQMDSPTSEINEEILSEWKTIGEKPHGIENLMMYMPANRKYENIDGINKRICKKVTLGVKTVQPEALSGLLQGISDKGALSLPDIFRHWRERKATESSTFGDFVKFFNSNDASKAFYTLSERNDEGSITLHSATFDNVSRSLNTAMDFFDNEGSISLDYEDILQPRKMSILDFSGESGPRFGSVLLRDILKKIVDAKSSNYNKTPVLIIIDEVHQFYGTDSSREALSDLDTICRTGRSNKIGIIFASQSINDMPSGLTQVINTQILFKTDSQTTKTVGVKITQEEMEGLKKGYAVVSIHDLPQLKVIKFPMSLSGVVKR